MTSKISCIKLIKEDLRQRTWLIAILSMRFTSYFFISASDAYYRNQ